MRHINIWLLTVLILTARAYARQTNDTGTLNTYNKIPTESGKLQFLLHDDPEAKEEFIRNHKAVFDSLVSSIHRGGNTRNKYLLSLFEGLLAFQRSQYLKAIPIYMNALNQKAFITTEDSLKILRNLKFCFVKTLDYPRAFEMHEALIALIKRNNSFKDRNPGVPLSTIYANMGLYNQGINYLKKEYLEDREKDKYSEANYLNNCGVIFQKANKPDSAIYFFSKAQEIVKRYLNEDPGNRYCVFFDGLIEGNIAQAMMEKGNTQQAIPMLLKDIRSSLSTNHLQNAAISYNELAVCYFQLNNYMLAEKYLDSSGIILSGIDAPFEKLRNIKRKAKLLHLTGRYKEAGRAYEQFISLNDSIASTEKELQMLNQQVAFHTDEMQDKIEEQENQMVKERQLKDKRKMQAIVLFAVIAVLVFIIISAYYSYTKSKKRESELSEKNQEITRQSEMLKSALKEKEVLIKEVHHRVKNNMQIVMSLLNLQSGKINQEAVRVHFSEARDRIQSMALIHELLYKREDLELLRVDTYIQQLTDEIRRSYKKSGQQVELIRDCEEILLNFDLCIPIGLIINELVTNAFKHAFTDGAGKILISFKMAPAGYHLMVKDNGTGLPDNFEQKKKNSLGMELIVLLGRQINASIETRSNNGMEVNIFIPGLEINNHPGGHSSPA